MSSKHLACFFIGVCMGLMMWGTLKVKTKMRAMQDEAAAAESAALTALAQRQTAEREMMALRTETAGLRDYLDRWQPFLQQTETTEVAEVRLLERIKQGGLLVFNNRFQVAPNSDGSFIPKVGRVHVQFEDDYTRCLQWLGSLEKNLPTSRVSLCRVSKGQNANDIRMQLTIDVPLTAAAADNSKKS